MKEPKLYYHLDKRSTTKDGRHPVKLVVYYKCKQSFISVGYYFTEGQWRVVQDRDIKKHKFFETSQGNSSSEVLNDIRAELDTFMRKANNAVEYLRKRGVPYNASDIKFEYEKDHTADDDLIYFKECNIAYIKSRTELGASLSTISSYTSIYNTFTEYYEGLSKRNDISKLRLVQIDARMLRAYKDHLVSTKQDSQATVGVHYRYLRALFNYAISKGVIVKEAYPFGSTEEPECKHQKTPSTKTPPRKEAKKWMIPANPKYFDVAGCLEKLGYVYWRQHFNFQTGDTIYIYVSSPESAVKYKCVVEEHDLPFSEDFSVELEFFVNPEDYESSKSHNRFMKLRLMSSSNSDKMSMLHLLENGMNRAPQGALNLSHPGFAELLHYIESNF